MFIDSFEFSERIKAEFDTVDSLCKLIKNKMKNGCVSHMIAEYFDFMNKLESNANNGIAPAIASDNVKLIWKLHLLHPSIYRMDCMKRFGKVIIPTQSDLELAFDSNDYCSHMESKPSSNVILAIVLILQKSLVCIWNLLKR